MQLLILSRESKIRIADCECNANSNYDNFLACLASCSMICGQCAATIFCTAHTVYISLCSCRNLIAPLICFFFGFSYFHLHLACVNMYDSWPTIFPLQLRFFRRKQSLISTVLKLEIFNVKKFSIKRVEPSEQRKSHGEKLIRFYFVVLKMRRVILKIWWVKCVLWVFRNKIQFYRFRLWC